MGDRDEGYFVAGEVNSPQLGRASKEGSRFPVREYLHPSKIFVLNIPEGSDEKGLESVFKAAGDVKEIHIPSLPNRAGKFFCFVTYEVDVDIFRAIELFNGSKLGGLVLFAAQAKEKKSSVLKTQYAQTEPLKGEDLRLFLTKKRLDNLCKAAVQGVQSECLKSLASKAWMGVSNFAVSASSIQDEIGSKGVFDVEVRDLGNRVLLINCADSEFEDKMIEEGWCWLKSWLTMVHGKEDLLSKGGFFKWVKIQGVPIKGWKFENFEGIANRLGTCLFVHPDTFDSSKFINGTVLIHCQKPARVNECISLQLGEDFFCVHASELDLNQIPPVTSSSERLSEENKGSTAGLNDDQVEVQEADSSEFTPTLNEVHLDDSAEVNASFSRPIGATENFGVLNSHKDLEVPASGNESKVADSEETISNNIRFSKKKGKKTKNAKVSTLKKSKLSQFENNSASDESIARQTYGPDGFAGAIKYIKRMGFNTKGKDDLLREHLNSLREEKENWQNFVEDMSGEYEQGFG